MVSSYAEMRLIATDLDGTLLRGNRTVSERTRLALGRARAIGMQVVLASARPPRVLREMARDLGISGLAICCNGAIVYDLETDTIIHHRALEPGVAREIISAPRTAMPGAYFGMEQALDYVCEPGYLALRGTHGDKPQRSGEAIALCMVPVTKLLMRHPTLPVEQMMLLAGQALRHPVTITHSGGNFVELAAAGVHKAGALEMLCADLAIAPAAVIAFGDMPNDLPMLQWAGLGVAVANAHPEVLALAHVVTASNQDDGVAIVIEEVLAARMCQ
jgi:Cof subfamily protein (haloacid dehalogenase superfamily)